MDLQYFLYSYALVHWDTQVTGTILWYLAYRTGMWRPMPLEKDLGEIEIVWEAETLGWISAFCYFL